MIAVIEYFLTVAVFAVAAVIGAIMWFSYDRDD